MLQVVEQTEEEQMKMYMKLSKKEIIKMLIEANKHLRNIPPTIVYPFIFKETLEKQPFHVTCSCNPDNGGSGICGCTMANMMVPKQTVTYQTYTPIISKEEGSKI